MRSTSPPKSAWPGVSTMLMRVSFQSTEVALARMVMPRSFSRSLESIARSATRWFSRNEPDCFRSSSTSVVFPWSTCAMIAILRIFMMWSRGCCGRMSGRRFLRLRGSYRFFRRCERGGRRVSRAVATPRISGLAIDPSKVEGSREDRRVEDRSLKLLKRGLATRQSGDFWPSHPPPVGPSGMHRWMLRASADDIRAPLSPSRQRGSSTPGNLWT